MKKNLLLFRTFYCYGRQNVLATLFLVTACSATGNVFAQLFDLSPEMQASLDAAKEKEGGYSGVEKKADIGFNVGVFFATGFGYKIKSDVENFIPEEKSKNESGFFLSEGLQFIRKGSKDKEGDAKTKLNYIELIISLAYYKEISGGSLYAGIGPYIAYGIGGKISGGGFSEKAFSSDGYKRFDAGPRIMAGYVLQSGLSVSLAYELGLVDKSTNPSDYTSKNRAFSVNVGYSLKKLFGKK